MRQTVFKLAAVVALSGCAHRAAAPAAASSPVVIAFAHMDECPDPFTESMAWSLVEGVVTEVLNARDLRILTADGERIHASIANIGERTSPMAIVRLKELVGNRRVSVMVNPSDRDDASIVGEVHVDNRDIGRVLLREGAATFAPAEQYTLPTYSECLNRIAEREAQNERAGVWADLAR